MEKQYRFKEIVKDYDGDYVGMIEFNYKNDTRDHEFTFVTAEQKLVSIDYGWRIPYIESVWDEIENHLQQYSITAANK